MTGVERAQRAEGDRDVAAAEPDRERLPVALVRHAADPAAGDRAGRHGESAAECEAAEGLEGRERARGHRAGGYPAATARAGGGATGRDGWAPRTLAAA